MKKAKALVIDVRDNIATALDPLEKGSTVSVDLLGRVERIKLLSAIPMGHKIALTTIEKGQAVVKYGEPIGLATSTIGRGEHVHTHNVASRPRPVGS